MKTCFKCLRALPHEDFYRHPMMADGRLGKCKECTKADVKARYALTIDARHAYEAKRNATPERKRQQRASTKRRRKAHPEKTAAHNAVANAIRAGRLTRQPCEVCGDPLAEGHHDDYSKPLDVRWLCFAHHREAHGQRPTSTRGTGNTRRSQEAA